MDAQRKLLEELMNPLLGTTKTYKDPQMCIYQLASGYCPYDLFTNTKCDIGVCDKKLHDEKLVAAYQSSADRYHLGHEQQFYNLANRLVQDMDRTVRRQKEKVNVQMGLDEAGQQAYGGIADAMKNEDDEKEERVAMLEGQIKEHLSQIMELGSAGSVDRAIDMWVTVELLKQNIESIRNATNNRRLVVCEICSATLVANDSTQRMQDHITGKQHVGYKKLREWVKDWENRRASLLGANGGGGAGGGDTRGGWGGPRGRDDHGAGGRRDDRRDHDRRDYDRRDDRGGGGYDRRYRR
ncbi:hypothetical protein HDU83_005369 [Entophlyctis luteolus]|nr:hypothetical protein HDU83_005369 [Entophlyctis luteolus]